MNLNELDKAVFAIQPWEADAEELCAQLLMRLQVTDSFTSTNEIARSYVQGYRSIACAFRGIAVAQDGERYQQASEWFLVAGDLSRGALFTHGWGEQERRQAFAIDYAMVMYLDGEWSIARNSLRRVMRQGHSVATLTAARMLLESDEHPVRVREGLKLLRSVKTSHLARYSNDFAQVVPEMVQALRSQGVLPSEYRINPRSLGWWIGQAGPQ